MIRQEDYVGELRQGLLLIADHIARLKSEEVAAAFAGFEAKGKYTEEPPEKIDLTQFQSGLASLLMHDFATGSSPLRTQRGFRGVRPGFIP